MKPTLIIFDRHRLVVDALSTLLRDSYEVVAVVTDRTQLKSIVPSLAPQLVLAGFSLQFVNGFDFLQVASGLSRRIPYVVVLGEDRRDRATARAAFEAGARAYVLRSSPPAELHTALKEALAGRYFFSPGLLDPQTAAEFHPQINPRDLFGHPLTPRQFQVLRLIAEGLQAKEIAARLDVAPKTIEYHRAGIMQCLGLHTTAELTRHAVKNAIVPPSLHPFEDTAIHPPEEAPSGFHVVIPIRTGAM